MYFLSQTANRSSFQLGDDLYVVLKYKIQAAEDGEPRTIQLQRVAHTDVPVTGPRDR